LANELAYIGAFAIAFAMTFSIIPWMIPKLIAKGIVGRDLNKPNAPRTAEMGGIAVVIGFFAGVSLLLAVDGVTDIALLNVSLAVILGAAFIGMIDDLFELRQRQKAFFPFLLALPLGAALNPTINLPFIGNIDFGPLMIIIAPFAITCAANAGNMLEGFNGLGTGLGVIMSTTLIILAVVHDRMDGVYILTPLIGCLLAFLWFNRYPAKIFPGDTLMLFMGATIAVAGMLSNLYFQTIIIFVPMITEFFLKMRGRFKAENYCSNAQNGHLEYHGRIESITHVFMKRWELREPRLVGLIWLLEGVICAAVIVIDLAI
jgi:UDP-N-acetylglucosamine--dolichyl-phosphate N-acetylglucosaminephosphotransferase